MFLKANEKAKCFVCGEEIDTYRKGLGFQVSTELRMTEDGYKDWQYAYICEPCILKKFGFNPDSLREPQGDHGQC